MARTRYCYAILRRFFARFFRRQVPDRNRDYSYISANR
ncbi:hypothetical protein A4U88_3948 [Serratia marcescens]|nr:hypothetical protein A4U88_3948 [Serratia marcescens]